MSPGAARPTAKPKPRTAAKKASAAARKPSSAAKRAAPAAKDPATAKGSSMVVGFDGGTSARAAVEWAASVLPPDGRIVLVYSCRPLHAPASPISSAAERRRLGSAVIDEFLLEAPKRLFEREILAEVSDRDPVSAMTTAARRHGASGIVVGSGRHSRLHKALGTVTSDLLKSSPVPVTAVPHHG